MKPDENAIAGALQERADSVIVKDRLDELLATKMGRVDAPTTAQRPQRVLVAVLLFLVGVGAVAYQSVLSDDQRVATEAGVEGVPTTDTGFENLPATTPEVSNTPDEVASIYRSTIFVTSENLRGGLIVDLGSSTEHQIDWGLAEPISGASMGSSRLYAWPVDGPVYVFDLLTGDRIGEVAVPAVATPLNSSLSVFEDVIGRVWVVQAKSSIRGGGLVAGVIDVYSRTLDSKVSTELPAGYLPIGLVDNALLASATGEGGAAPGILVQAEGIISPVKSDLPPMFAGVNSAVLLAKGGADLVIVSAGSQGTKEPPNVIPLPEGEKWHLMATPLSSGAPHLPVASCSQQVLAKITRVDGADQSSSFEVVSIDPSTGSRKVVVSGPGTGPSVAWWSETGHEILLLDPDGVSVYDSTSMNEPIATARPLSGLMIAATSCPAG